MSGLPGFRSWLGESLGTGCTTAGGRAFARHADEQGWTAVLDRKIVVSRRQGAIYPLPRGVFGLQEKLR